MNDSRYEVVFLTSAINDMTEIVRYISENLKNYDAAESLAQKFIDEADKLSAFPYARPLYAPFKSLKYEYRWTKINNYLMFYRINEQDKTVIITRVIYDRRNHADVLNNPTK